MSVAPGSGRGSFRVLYIALIYMSLEINLAYILPHRPPPLRLPMPPSPSGLSLHLRPPWSRDRHRWVDGEPGGSCWGAGQPGTVTWRGTG